MWCLHTHNSYMLMDFYTISILGWGQNPKSKVFWLGGKNQNGNFEFKGWGGQCNLQNLIFDSPMGFKKSKVLWLSVLTSPLM